MGQQSTRDPVHTVDAACPARFPQHGGILSWSARFRGIEKALAPASLRTFGRRKTKRVPAGLPLPVTASFRLVSHPKTSETRRIPGSGTRQPRVTGSNSERTDFRGKTITALGKARAH